MNDRDIEIHSENNVNLAALDLNLLVVLDAVLAERSVTRAARRVGLSQPATSNALGRLRGQLSDPLLVRSAGGMQPTPFAARLEAPLRDLLARLSSVLAPRRGFVPAEARGAVTIAVSDYASRVVVPPLVERLAARAPGLDLHVRTHDQRLPVEDLGSGAVLVTLGFFWSVEAPLVATRLVEERLVCLRPVSPDPLTLPAYLEAAHVLVSQSGRTTGHVDALLRARGEQRRVRTVVPHFSSVAPVLKRVGGVATLPARLADAYAGDGLEVVPAPLELPGFSLTAVHHRRMQDDAALRWLQQQLAEVAGGPLGSDPI